MRLLFLLLLFAAAAAFCLGWCCARLKDYLQWKYPRLLHKNKHESPWTASDFLREYAKPEKQR